VIRVKSRLNREINVLLESVISQASIQIINQQLVNVRTLAISNISHVLVFPKNTRRASQTGKCFIHVLTVSQKKNPLLHKSTVPLLGHSVFQVERDRGSALCQLWVRGASLKLLVEQISKV